MAKKVLFISSSLRNRSNSEAFAREAEKGAKAAGHETEFITLKDKDIRFCKGCMACQKTFRCVIKDDVADVMERVQNADVLVFATPVYYYELAGQLKTLLDRLNPLYPQEYSFRDVYLITASAEAGENVVKTPVGGINGWIDCFEKARFAGVFNGGGFDNMGEALEDAEMLAAAFEFGKGIQ
ncbi:MAG: flavodoxin family protein [Clostridia bacterium]|nr:flavodoxin family protein [Clostridia bacterium]